MTHIIARIRDRNRQLNHQLVDAIGGPAFLAHITSLTRSSLASMPMLLRQAAEQARINDRDHNYSANHSETSSLTTAVISAAATASANTDLASGLPNNSEDQTIQSSSSTQTPSEDIRPAMPVIHNIDSRPDIPVSIEFLVRRLPSGSRTPYSQREQGGVSSRNNGSNASRYTWPVLRRRLDVNP